MKHLKKFEGFSNRKCDRCGKQTNTMSMSWLNTDECCMDCLEIEKSEPDYMLAKAKEQEEVKSGNYNYSGIRNESSDNKPSISFEDAKSWIKENYSEDKVIEMFDDEVAGGDWIDTEQMEEEGYESEHDYYTDYGNGEAESAVIDVIFNDLKSKFSLDFDMYSDDTDLHDFMKEEYMCLWKA